MVVVVLCVVVVVVLCVVDEVVLCVEVALVAVVLAMVVTMVGICVVASSPWVVFKLWVVVAGAVESARSSLNSQSSRSVDVVAL